jgi:hypothetical protein
MLASRSTLLCSALGGRVVTSPRTAWTVYRAAAVLHLDL